jgi:hypothetical protein
MAMDAKIGRFFDAVGSFFSGGESIPWCDRDVIAVRAESIHSQPAPVLLTLCRLVLAQFCWFKQNASMCLITCMNISIEV